jgi:creatinase
MESKNLIRIENGEKVKRTFSDAEYAGRQCSSEKNIIKA